MGITVEQYFMGRDKQYPTALSVDWRSNASRTVQLVNLFLQRAQSAGVPLFTNPRSKSVVSSGWRPPEVNSVTPGAAPRSKHITCQAVDIYDPEGDLDDWCMTDAGQRALADIGLWLEHPSATKGWCHLQTVPPNSKRRVFYP